MNQGEEVFGIFPARIRNALKRGGMDQTLLQEIRMRVGQPLICIYDGKERFLSPGGGLTQLSGECLTVSKEELMETVSYVSRYSLYAFDE